jgi:hypothetical protein
MQELVFQVEFLSDIVLPATSNTEGNISQLDFIPGSNFLGMAAKEYTKYANSFDVFHSGKVRFGDATLLHNEKQTYKMPLSIFYEKTDASRVINQLQTPLSSLKQAKQLRNGYITKDKELLFVEYNYSQKSAYDTEKRRSKDSTMFGYSAIRSGTTWQFSLKYDETMQSDIERVKNNLLGIKRLGKSKSAEYGEVNITLSGQNENIEESGLKEELILYVNSRLALIDAEGNPTYDLRYLCDGLKQQNIDYTKTQLKTATFTPYNTTRETKDYERVVINKGSVIVLKNITNEQLESIKCGVGAYLSEGFGEVLINPSFLMDATFTLKKVPTQKVAIKAVEITTPTAKFLRAKQDAKESKLALANEVHLFIEGNKTHYPQKMNSQWGSLRSLCANSADIYADVKEYISHGVAADKWEGKKSALLLSAIEKSNNPLEFTKLLSMQMPKVKNKDEEQKDAN